ncbi:glyoxylate/hydroxypyruvate reductase HPR3-like [Gastrolobium bilobum]|uniref:glyoxylate/hydroxypyruvate reductase HPR3-like n=1 Tax=Gastrolobium bilobum TaxID=150636 RepID=UPI002AB310D1|nr:glyoxylate/hydroxypyruvate reductase HPR3-like [Gastrolobium bilobum]
MANQNLPRVLLLLPPMVSSEFQRHYSNKFHFLNLSSLPLRQFIATGDHDPSSITALICYGGQPLNADALGLFPSLRLVLTPSSGTDHIDLSECGRRGVQVAGIGNLFSEDVADLAVGLLIDVVTKISAADRYLRRHVPPPWNFPLGSKLGDKKVGIIGLGKIGLEVAHRLVKGFGCTVLYHSRSKKPFVSYPFYGSVVELATNSDVLVLCCELNDQTRHMINREVMLALGKEGIIINVGRGALIDEKELLKCLMDGEVGGAGLDVFEGEPHVPKEFFGLDNVVLSPHLAALTSESYMGMCQLMAHNLEAFFSNKPLITPVIVD